LKSKSLAIELNNWYEKTCTADFIALDPVNFPHLFNKREDIEIAAFLAATIAWGRRDLILRSAKKMFSLMEPSPYKFVMSGDFKKLKSKNIHRTFFESDLKYFCRGFEYIFKTYGSIELLFVSLLRYSVWEGFYVFREDMAKANKGQYSKHIADSEKSACKRLNLALRWLVRKGPVDLGLWEMIFPPALYIPLDVHVARTARDIGLLKRKSDDKKAVIELTQNLRKFDGFDPVKYDFALFGMGVMSG
jgi:uncharacterized protein (TIGR02757 family)